MAFPTTSMVLAAGLGLRMRPLTDHKPKPLLSVGGKTLLDRSLDWLADSGVEQAVVNSFYKGEMIEAHIASRTRPAIQISREETLLETGGGIKQALPLLGKGPFFSVNSDTITLDTGSSALKRLSEAWSDDIDALLLLQPLERAIGFDGNGDFFLDEGGRLRRRLEAPSAPYVFTGVQLMHPRLFQGSPAGKFSLNVLYDRGRSSDGTLARVRGLVHDGHWLHVGDPAGLELAEEWFYRQFESRPQKPAI